MWRIIDLIGGEGVERVGDGLGQRADRERTRSASQSARSRRELGQAARDAVIPIVDRRPELLHADNACERNERDQQRVLDQVLPLILAHEPNKQPLHFFALLRLMVDGAPWLRVV